MRYNCELKFVIPHFREVEEAVKEINHIEMKNKVLYELDLIGANYYMMQPVKEVIDGVAYDAEMVIVYCGEAIEKAFVESFENVCRECMKAWDINMITYVHNGVLVTVEEE